MRELLRNAEPLGRLLRRRSTKLRTVILAAEECKNCLRQNFGLVEQHEPSVSAIADEFPIRWASNLEKRARPV